MSDINPVKWHFRQMGRAEMNEDSEPGELFGDQSTNEPLSVRLVREVIQNSLDASISKKSRGGERTIEAPVQVRFSLSGLSKPLPAYKAKKYFSGLQGHLISIEELDDQVLSAARDGTLIDTDVPFIVIEDFGTTGLRGDPTRYNDPDPDSNENDDFYWFFRNVGRTGKLGNENGSWGYGKWVLPDASGAHAFFALTTTDEDTLLMGQSILKIHYAGKAKFAPYGYWSQPEGEDEFAMPLRISDDDQRQIIEDFMSDFGLPKRDKTGLSVVIPFPWDASNSDNATYVVSTKELVKAVVHNYFYPIVLGYLEVSITGEPGENPAYLNADTIKDVVEVIETTGSGQWTADSYRRIFQMLEDTLLLGTGEYTVLNSPPTADDGYIQADDLRALQQRYENNELLSFKIRTNVRPKTKGEEQTEFKVYLRREPGLDVGHDYYIRGTLSIPNMDFIENYKTLALIVVDEKERLAEMLRDSEPPAHTMWRPQAPRVRDRWVSPQRRINAVRDTVKNILSFLEDQPSGLQKDAFLDLFALTGQDIAAETGGESGRGTRTKPFENKIKPGPPSPFTISATKGGVSIHASKQAKELPDQIIIRAAYDVPRGNPFAKFNENDFAFLGKNRLRVKLDGGEILEEDSATPIGANAVRLKVKDRENFSFVITGFDEFRDVVVKIDSDDST